MSREEIDAIAWESIHSRPPADISDTRGTRPHSYLQIQQRMEGGVEFEHAWSDFLHAFYDYRDVSFFEHRSPSTLSVEWQALLAGAAEWLSAEFGLEKPSWVDDPLYFLDAPWDPVSDEGLDMSQFIGFKLESSPEAFRRRNIAFLSRNLIAL